ncbi:alginate lyase family protein [Pseudalkalibacillus caeni]|uniref:alginate lyase family protein n=1 Tax=Exobacillus caeni TaxID=2574798 RepID=UPI001484EE45|nr:alginate lyase family protein [Pseudalkalibacillus caeni]
MNKKITYDTRHSYQYIDIYHPLKKQRLYEVCNDLLQNKIYLTDNYPVIDAGDSDMWLIDPVDRSWRFWLHSFLIVGYLVDGYTLFGNEEYLNKAITIVLDWKKKNGSSSDSEMAWHDHSTALRLMMLCKLFYYIKKADLGERDGQELRSLVQQHGDMLANEDFYIKKHNHGLDQDIALYIAATFFPDLPGSTTWAELALHRFWEQMDHLFAKDGSYQEHSPDYVYILIDRLIYFYMFLKNHGIEDNQELKERIEGILHFFQYVLQPDGSIPPIGDSEARQVNLQHHYDIGLYGLKALEQFLEKRFRERYKVTLPLENVFPEGGYAVFRNKWPYDVNTVQMLFSASFHSRVHKHHDDLSFTLFGSGHPLLIDAGKYNYDYESPERKFVVSNKAHNTVTVDEANTDISRLNIGKSGLSTYGLHNDVSYAAGFHCLYPGVSHRRIFIYLKPWDIIIFDDVRGYKDDHLFDQYFHLHPALTGSLTGPLVKANNSNHVPLLSIQQLYTNDDYSCEIVKGHQEPLEGWASSHYSTLEPINSVRYRVEGKEARFATHLNLSPARQTDYSVSWEEDEIHFTFDRRKLTVILAKEKEYFFLNNKQLPNNSIGNPKLKQALNEKNEYEYKQKYRYERKRKMRYLEELERYHTD